jgi:hypothetical protein
VSPLFEAFKAIFPEGDRRVFSQPDMKAMFIDDILVGTRHHAVAPILDLIQFSRDWASASLTSLSRYGSGKATPTASCPPDTPSISRRGSPTRNFASVPTKATSVSCPPPQRSSRCSLTFGRNSRDAIVEATDR